MEVSSWIRKEVGPQVGWSLSAGGSVKGILGRGPGEPGYETTSTVILC
jgi:hypothetical protein